MKKLAALALSPLAFVACVETPLPGSDVIDLAPLDPDGALQGVAKDPIGDDLHVLVEGIGVLQINRNGELQKTRSVGENGLEDRPYKDIAVIGDGRFLFIADNEGYLYDEVSQQERVHFCVEPGFDPNEPQPTPTVVTQKNDALALTSGAILAAPRFYEDGAQIEASLRTYDVGSGEPTGSVDLSGLGLDLAGLDVDGDSLVGVSGNVLTRFTLNGEALASVDIDVEDAAGLVVDGDHALVLDRAQQRIVSFDISDVR